jgi:hypothetical protein
VYEATEMSPQNMDFDATNNMFTAHSGWYNDQLIHYYKFRIFAPDTYPGTFSPLCFDSFCFVSPQVIHVSTCHKTCSHAFFGAHPDRVPSLFSFVSLSETGVVMMDGTSSDVPVQKIYMVTTTGGFDGVVGMPIIEYHHVDGNMYSDFMAVTFVDAPDDYVTDMYKSVGDLANATMTESGIVLNIPLVPTGSTLQHPVAMGTNTAPILPTPAFYRGVEVWTYVFEVTDSSAAAFFSSTRSETGAAISRQSSTATEYGIPVVTTFATPTSVNAILLMHVNQFSTGVVAGKNGGGPNPAGMRNVIDLDRSDAGYSPLWQLYWVTELPVNYMADEFSNAAQATADNGIKFFTAPMYVNCPDIGPIGAKNTMMAEMFEMMINLGDMMSGNFTLIGSHPSLIMMGGKKVDFMSDTGDKIGTTMTNMMGGYEYTLQAADIPEGTSMVMVMLEDGTTIRNVTVSTMSGGGGDMSGGGGDMSDGGDMNAPSGSATRATLAVSLLVTAMAFVVTF